MPRKQYGPAPEYERKLARVMERLGVKEFTFDYSRREAWVQFRYKDGLYRFEHSVDKAQARGLKVQYGSDAFAQIVLALEDLARMVERGIYDLQTWCKGMKYLPPVPEVPSFFQFLRFDRIPDGPEEVRVRYRELAKVMHPDAGGSHEDFERLTRAKEQGIMYFGKR